MNVVKVFCDKNGNYGDEVTIVEDQDRKISDKDRVKLASKQNGVETVFINDLDTRNISIVHSQGEIGFAGTVALAASWFLSTTTGETITSMQGRDSEIDTWSDSDIVWVSADSANFPPWNLTELESVDGVERMKVSDTKNIKHTLFWSWVDKTKGKIRARTFAADWDIPEAEGNGSGAMLLAMSLDREIEIIHGNGSVIFAKAESKAKPSLGGRVR